MTVPGSASDSCSRIVNPSPARLSVASADSRARSITSGTSTCVGPLETNSSTREPTSAVVPPGGFVLIASPSSTESELAWRTSTLKPHRLVSSRWPQPARFSSRTARSSEKPSTVGIVTLPGPVETVSVTVDPSSASVPPPGSWWMTSPTGARSGWRSTSTSKPSSVRRSTATASGWPTTRSTSTLSPPVKSSRASATRSAVRPSAIHGQRSLRSSSSSTRRASVGRDRHERGRVLARAAGPATPARAPSSARMNSSASAQRIAGSLASARMTAASSSGATSGRSVLIGVGSSFRCWTAIATALSPSNGSRPVSSSYRMIPTE